MQMLRRQFVWPLCIALLAGMTACGELQWRDAAPVKADQPEPATPEALAAECSRLRGEIRHNQITAQQAPSTTSAPIIADASIGKADRNIDRLQQRYGDLGCASQADQSPGAPAPAMPAQEPAPPAPMPGTGGAP
jgi:hypothetical protein